ncbi:hypothetical protein [Actinomadura sp. WMMB 499]|uniref:hypothetical protein n=1 Tax=Actinomadura sp. WMMB 499 TaxID=1219491 RepID=UPI0012458EC6|nr:hypothetical protein [Actinomadura sp. WMMB 499]QFG20798.1 hypothetical protein F7P10_06190 [Actinomadura sp. WMMB 499]
MLALPFKQGITIPYDSEGGGDPLAEKRDSILWGAAGDNLSGSDYPQLDDRYGPLTIRRVYQRPRDGIPRSWAASNAGADAGKRASCWSGKPDMAAVASGSLDERILGFLRSVPKAHVAFVTIWHEPDVKLKNGTFSLSTYRAGFRRFCRLAKRVQEDGWSRLYTVQIVTTWAGTNPSKGRTYADMWPGDGLVDCYGADGYSHVGSKESLWGPAVEFARSRGIPWCVPEIGYGNRGSQNVSWMKDQIAYMTTTAAGGKHTRCAFACWFDTAGPISNPTPGNDRAWIAAARKASREHFFDHSRFVL